MSVILNESFNCTQLVRELVRTLRDNKEIYGLTHEDTTHVWPAIDVFIRLLGENGTEVLLEDLLEGANGYLEQDCEIEMKELSIKDDKDDKEERKDGS